MQLKNFVVAFALAAVVHLKDISGISTYHPHTHNHCISNVHTSLPFHFFPLCLVVRLLYICYCYWFFYLSLFIALLCQYEWFHGFFLLVCLPFHHPVKLLECVCVLFCCVFFFFRNSSNAQGPRYFAFVNIFKVYFFSFSLLLFFLQEMRLRSMRNAQLRE